MKHKLALFVILTLIAVGILAQGTSPTPTPISPSNWPIGVHNQKTNSLFGNVRIQGIFKVDSTTQVPNLNAEYVGGHHWYEIGSGGIGVDTNRIMFTDKESDFGGVNFTMYPFSVVDNNTGHSFGLGTSGFYTSVLRGTGSNGALSIAGDLIPTGTRRIGTSAARILIGYIDTLYTKSIIGPYPSPGVTREVATSGRQYTSIQTAVNASSSGDLIVIYPGTYNEIITAKNGVGFFFFPQVILTGTGANGVLYVGAGVTTAVTGNLVSNSTTTLGVVVDGGTYSQRGSISVQSYNAVTVLNGGSLTLRDCDITTHSAITSDAGIILDPAIGTVVLKNVTITTESATGLCIDAQGACTVYLRGPLFTNRVKNSIVNFDVNNYIQWN